MASEVEQLVSNSGGTSGSLKANGPPVPAESDGAGRLKRRLSSKLMLAPIAAESPRISMVRSTAAGGSGGSDGRGGQGAGASPKVSFESQEGDQGQLQT